MNTNTEKETVPYLETPLKHWGIPFTQFKLNFHTRKKALKYSISTFILGITGTLSGIVWLSNISNTQLNESHMVATVVAFMMISPGIYLSMMEKQEDTFIKNQNKLRKIAYDFWLNTELLPYLKNKLNRNDIIITTVTEHKGLLSFRIKTNDNTKSYYLDGLGIDNVGLSYHRRKASSGLFVTRKGIKNWSLFEINRDSYGKFNYTLID